VGTLNNQTRCSCTAQITAVLVAAVSGRTAGLPGMKVEIMHSIEGKHLDACCISTFCIWARKSTTAA